ncbi:NADH dehydrogenase (ubiquinone) B22 subunit [Rhynchophorus ferrugineus]|uniref:NADH dehydrogenase [ubiquinone] 1 beta subcomplex subunit 9 n=1 Tax=Rhynchophorus ferrugineus TaxID=354439 RepID=A0A834MBT9_RHYFE|nr:hypothetical protein GWI33_011148 [Rhynchophorus ferrugineus]
MATSLPTGLTTHTRKVQSLYKRVLRNLESYYDRREVYRYHAVLMRKRFDDNRDIKDARIAKDFLLKGEQELFKNLHYHVRQFPNSPGGVAYGRVVIPPDWVLDYWHPLEKAQYPEYFARREQRKKEYIKFWEQQYGPSTSSDHH